MATSTHAVLPILVEESSLYGVPGSEIVGSAELRKLEHVSKNRIKAVIDMFWRLTNQDFNIRLVKKAKNYSLLAGVSLLPSSRAPRFSHANKTPLISFPFQMHATQASSSKAKGLNSFAPYAEHYHCTDSF